MPPLKKKERSNAGRIQGPQEVAPLPPPTHTAFAAGFSTSLLWSFGQGRHLSARHQCCLLQPEYRQCKRKPPTNTLFYSVLEKLLSCTATCFNNEGHCSYLWVLRKRPNFSVVSQYLWNPFLKGMIINGIIYSGSIVTFLDGFFFFEKVSKLYSGCELFFIVLGILEFFLASLL